MRRPPMALELAAAYSVEYGYRIEGMISAAVAGTVISLSRTLQFAREIEGSTSAAAAPCLPSLPFGFRRSRLDCVMPASWWRRT